MTMRKKTNKSKKSPPKPPVESVPVKEAVEDSPEELLQSTITPSLRVQPDHARVNGVFHRIVKTIGYPRKVEDGWLEAFLAASEPYDISLHIQPASINATLVLLHNQLIRQMSDLIASTAKGTPNPSLEIKHADTMRVYESLYKGEEKLFRVSLYVDNQANDLARLDLLTEKCKANMNAIMVIPKIVEYRVANGIKSMLPQAQDALDTNREFLTSSLSATFPFLYPVNSVKSGLFFAHEKNTLNPLFLDFDSMSNKHFFVLGISGSGKSYSAKFLIIQHLLANRTKVYILDPNAEYRQLAARMQGEIIDLSKHSNSQINLFDLAGEDYATKMLSLISVFDIITGGLTESQKGVLNEALLKVYANAGIHGSEPDTWKRVPPTFSDLKGVLANMLKGKNKRTEDKSTEVLNNRVRMYCKDGFFGFLDQQTKVNLQNEFIDFDLSMLPPQVKQLVMFAVLELISREIRKNKDPKVILIDEGWSLLRSKEAENYILEFIKTSRKYNASIGFITQEIEDLLRSDGGKSILNTTSTKILLRQNSSNLDLIAKTLALNSDEKNFLLRAGKGEGLLIGEQGRYEFKIKAPDEIHQLITTNPNEELPAEPVKVEKNVEVKKQPKIDLSKGYYALNGLSEGQRDELIKDGYSICKSRFTQAGGETYYFVKRQGRETGEHALFTWYIVDELQKKGIHAEVNGAVEPDITCTIANRKICFEIETGEVLYSHGPEYVKNKFQERKKQYDELIVVVTHKRFRARYSHLVQSTVLLRTQIVEKIAKLARAT